MTKLQKAEMYAEIQKHGENLNSIFNTGIEPVKLCKKLRSLEKKANKIAMDFCNGEGGATTDNVDNKIFPIMGKVYSILNNGVYNDDRPHKRQVPVFFNSDARGYQLKINDGYVNLLKLAGKDIYTDWGGYGIIAPDFTPNN